MTLSKKDRYVYCHNCGNFGKINGTCKNCGHVDKPAPEKKTKIDKPKPNKKAKKPK